MLTIPIAARMLCVFLLLAPAATPAMADLATGLLAHYPFEGNALDASGNGNHGTPGGNAVLTSDRFGSANGAYFFDGVNSQITIPSSASLASPTNQITMAAWMLLYGNSKVGSSFWPLIMKSNTTENAFMYRLSGDLTGFGAAYNDWGTQQGAPYAFALGTWTFVATVYDGSIEHYYVNGTQTGQTSRSLVITSDNRPLVIGADTPGVYECFWGKIDDVRIYNRALTPAEILELSQQTVGVEGDPTADLGFGLQLGANPSAGRTSVVFSLPHAAQARVALYDAGGRLIRVLFDGWLSAGEHPLYWDGRTDAGGPVGAGVFFVQARSEGRDATKRLVWLH